MGMNKLKVARSCNMSNNPYFSFKLLNTSGSVPDYIKILTTQNMWLIRLGKVFVKE